MPLISAADCISPAFSRTRLILFAPFMKGRTWKLSATGYLATAGNLFLPFPFVYLLFLPAVSHFGKPAVIGLVTACTLAVAIFLFLFVLFSRLQFAFFDVVLNREQFVAPLWRKYRSVYGPWTWLKVLAGLVLVLALAAPIAAYGHRLFALSQSMAALKPGQMPPVDFFVLLYGGFLSIYAVFILLFFIGSLGYDFLVPSLALESVPLAEAFRRVGRLIRAEPGQFALYCLLKFVLGCIGYMALMIAFELCIFVVFAVVGAIAFLLGFLLHLAGVPSAVLLALGIVLAIAIYLFLFVYCMVLALGVFFTFFEAYSLYFLAGRYPLVADLLARSTPAPSPPPLPEAWNPAFYTPQPPV